MYVKMFLVLEIEQVLTGITIFDLKSITPQYLYFSTTIKFAWQKIGGRGYAHLAPTVSPCLSIIAVKLYKSYSLHSMALKNWFLKNYRTLNFAGSQFWPINLSSFVEQNLETEFLKHFSLRFFLHLPKQVNGSISLQVI